MTSVTFKHKQTGETRTFHGTAREAEQMAVHARNWLASILAGEGRGDRPEDWVIDCNRVAETAVDVRSKAKEIR